MWLKQRINGYRPLRRRVRYSEARRWRATVAELRGIKALGCTLADSTILSYWGALCYRAPRPALWYRTRYIWHGKVHKWGR